MVEGELPLPNKGFRAAALLATVDEALIAGLEMRYEKARECGSSERFQDGIGLALSLALMLMRGSMKRRLKIMASNVTKGRVGGSSTATSQCRRQWKPL